MANFFYQHKIDTKKNVILSLHLEHHHRLLHRDPEVKKVSFTPQTVGGDRKASIARFLATTATKLLNTLTREASIFTAINTAWQQHLQCERSINATTREANVFSSWSGKGKF